MKFAAQYFDFNLDLSVTLIYGGGLGGMLASYGTALAAESFGTMTAAITLM